MSCRRVQGLCSLAQGRVKHSALFLLVWLSWSDFNSHSLVSLTKPPLLYLDIWIYRKFPKWCSKHWLNSCNKAFSRELGLCSAQWKCHLLLFSLCAEILWLSVCVLSQLNSGRARSLHLSSHCSFDCFNKSFYSGIKWEGTLVPSSLWGIENNLCFFYPQT